MRIEWLPCGPNRTGLGSASARLAGGEYPG